MILTATQSQNTPAAPRPRPKMGRGGFTLIELLTVLAIIAVLATLLMSALSSAKKFSKQAKCTSNLHQIALSTTMYLDDHRWKPMELTNLTASGYLPASEVIQCPSDRLGNWGNLVNYNPTQSNDSAISMTPSRVLNPPGAEIPYSYLHALNWEKWAWETLTRNAVNSAVVVCQLHGLGRQDSGSPTMWDFEGLVLRSRLDGAVVRDQLFWNNSPMESGRFADSTAAPAGFAPPMITTASPNPYPWELFTEESPQP